MNILLPPSRRQALGGQLTWSESCGVLGPELSAHRSAVLDEIARHTGDDLRESLAIPAGDRFRGVVYEHIGTETLDAKAKEVSSGVLIISPLLGVVGWNDPIPAHRLEFSDRFDLTGRLARYWPQHLTGPLFGMDLTVGLLPEEHRKVLRNVTGVLHCSVVRADNGRGGHDAKAAKGRFVRALLLEGDLDEGDFLSFAVSYVDGLWRVIPHSGN